MADTSVVRGKIAGWTLEAGPKDADRIFVTPRMATDMRNIRDGNTCVVLGRKGVGKSGLMHRFAKQYEDEVTFRKIEFDPELLLARIRRFGADFNLSSAQKIFQLDFLIHAADELSYALPDRKAAQSARAISEYYTRLSPRRYIGTTLRKYNIQSALVSLLGVFFGAENVNIPRNAAFSDYEEIERQYRVLSRTFRELLRTNPPRKPVFIVYDEIDQVVSTAKTEDKIHDYIQIAEALLLAAANFRQLEGGTLPVYPIIVLRSDIFDRIRNDDIQKLRGNAADVKFSRDDVANIIKHRLQVELTSVLGAGGAERLSLAEAWAKIFSAGFDGGNGFDALLDRSLLRARDVVAFMRIMATISLQRSGAKTAMISAEDYRKARPKYGEHFWNELEDEMRYVYSFGDEIRLELQNLFTSRVGGKKKAFFKPTVTKADVINHFEAFAQRVRSRGQSVDSRELLNDLLKRSVLGARMPGGGGGEVLRFHYEDDIERDIQEVTSVALHRAIMNYFDDRIKSNKS
ncbi:MAG: hypothetical protein ABL883_10050 [Terricaulis sp.]